MLHAERHTEGNAALPRAWESSAANGNWSASREKAEREGHPWAHAQCLNSLQMRKEGVSLEDTA